MVSLSASTVGAAGVEVPGAGAADKQLEPIAPATSINHEKAELGKKLFFDPRLSKSGFISCNSCHNL
ncbi:MAG: cytochrome C biogenesis protein CcsA, partial [Candidatus Electrothrix sp. AR1]|nr:cytochrome C biogenesis protein CcsA [Candidatus Electrothrix sp. AR1]